MDVEPLVEALPAEEMATLGDDGVVSHVKADVALEIGSVAASLLIGFIGIGIGGRGRRLMGVTSLWWTSWLRAASGGPLPSLARRFLRR